METYQINGLTFRYPLQTEPALKAIDICVQPGELILLCGRSGCGKTTLLRHLKTVLTPHGNRSGRILFAGTALEQVDQRRQAQDIGFVMQSPDNQIVTDKVWHELAFGLESLGCNPRDIRLRVAEMASYFGIQDWFYQNVSELSGGQKQLLNLAAIMVMQPAVLILDEPTSQLDPIAAADFLATLKKINRDLGTTIIMTEQRLEEALPLSDRVLVMDQGRIVSDAAPRETGERLRTWQHEMFQAMPAPLQIHAGVKSASPAAPVTVGEGRQWLDTLALAPEPPGRPDPAPEAALQPAVIPALEVKNIWFKYEKNHPDVLKGLSLQVHQGQIQAVAGGNGTGKTTLLHLLAGIVKPYHGKVLVFGQVRGLRGRQRNEARIAVLPQNPQALLVKKTVALDLLEMLEENELSKEQRQQKMKAMAERVGLTELLARHPYDLSCGEQQRAALAKVLLLEPQILLLDEPTKGLDSHFKAALGDILKSLAAEGVAILMVSHDIEFCARHADRCALLFDGTVVTENTARAFFAGNSFYTTAANRMARHLYPDVVTSEDVIAKCSANLKNQNAGPAILLTRSKG
ncbi:MAG TPA: ATP-binding cassette domain-containing protein [Syntrophomonas sp.]|nr:ATP-binding cassette domain-containing protein [Syntrophomonas sp.]HRW12870.1 ATP-binding cassette domain-containing protein [Syntrophomonas sp.]